MVVYKRLRTRGTRYRATFCLLFPFYLLFFFGVQHFLDYFLFLSYFLFPISFVTSLGYLSRRFTTAYITQDLLGTKQRLLNPFLLLTAYMVFLFLWHNVPLSPLLFPFFDLLCFSLLVFVLCFTRTFEHFVLFSFTITWIIISSTSSSHLSFDSHASPRRILVPELTISLIVGS